MNDNRLFGRRQMLVGAGAAGAAAVLTGGMTRTLVASADAGSVTGAYLINITTKVPSGAPVFQSVLALTAGGVAISIDGNAQGATDLGGWEANGGEGFSLRFLRFFFDNKGNNVGHLTIAAKGEVDGDDVKGTFKATAFPTGAPSQVVATGTFAGRSIEP